jgi:hypothetical protein
VNNRRLFWWSASASVALVAACTLSAGGLGGGEALAEDGGLDDRTLADSSVRGGDAAMADAADASDADALATPAAATFSPPPGDYLGEVCITLSSPTPGAVIHYTLDGSPPTDASPTYSALLELQRSSIIRTVTMAPGFGQAAISDGEYRVLAPPGFVSSPNPSPLPGTYKQPLNVRLSYDYAPDAAVCYSLDGGEPGCVPGGRILCVPTIPAAGCPSTGPDCFPGGECAATSIPYDGGDIPLSVLLDGGLAVVKAIACEGEPSEVLSAAYVLTP